MCKGISLQPIYSSWSLLFPKHFHSSSLKHNWILVQGDYSVNCRLRYTYKDKLASSHETSIFTSLSSDIVSRSSIHWSITSECCEVSWCMQMPLGDRSWIQPLSSPISAFPSCRAEMDWVWSRVGYVDRRDWQGTVQLLWPLHQAAPAWESSLVFCLALLD